MGPQTMGPQIYESASEDKVTSGIMHWSELALGNQLHFNSQLRYTLYIGTYVYRLEEYFSTVKFTFSPYQYSIHWPSNKTCPQFIIFTYPLNLPD